jgi:sec-independent protein translocase protein TatC
MKNNKNNNLSILGHLSELRSRLIKCVIAVVITSIAAFVFSDQIFHVLTLPASYTGINLVYIDMTEMLSIYMTVCLSAGIAVAMPYLVYQILMFVFPALTPPEKKYILMMLPWTAIMFIAGAVFSYYVMLPPSIKFLLTFGSNIAVPQIRIGSYIIVITRVMLAAGVIFELPVISTFLARLGIVTSSWLASKRKIVIVLAFVIGALITPTTDPINQTLLAGPLIVLYELSIWLAKLVQPKKHTQLVLSTSDGSVGSTSNKL